MAATFCCCNCPVGPAAASNTTTTAFLLGENISTTLLPVHSTLSLSLSLFIHPPLPLTAAAAATQLNKCDQKKRRRTNQSFVKSEAFEGEEVIFFQCVFPAWNCVTLQQQRPQHGHLSNNHIHIQEAPAWPTLLCTMSFLSCLLCIKQWNTLGREIIFDLILSHQPTTSVTNHCKVNWTWFASIKSFAMIFWQLGNSTNSQTYHPLKASQQ